MRNILPIRRTLLAALMGSVLLSSSGAFAQPNVDKQLAKHASSQAFAAAQRDLAEFANHQGAGNASGEFALAVTNPKDLKQATVSYGFQVYTVDPADLIAGRSTMKAMAKPVNQWRFVIALKGQPIGLATVEKNKGKYETVSYGAAVLAKDLDVAARQHGNADKSNLRFLRIYQARSDFLEVDSADGRGRFAPLHSARYSMQMQSATSAVGKSAPTLLDETDLMQPLRSIVKQNMSAPL